MQGTREFVRSLGYAVASASELEYHLQKARDLELITLGEYLALMTQLVEVRKMLYGLIRRLRADGDREPSGSPRQ